jgi:hypothetical protein
LSTNLVTIKEQAVCWQPLLLATITLYNGTVLRYARQACTFAGQSYQARLIDENIPATQAASEGGIDQAPQVTLRLADADGFLWSNYEQPVGFDGAKLELVFAFYDAIGNAFSSDSRKIYEGLCEGADYSDITEPRLVFRSRIDISQTQFPVMRIAKLCPHAFPETTAQRTAAANDSESPFFGCGYSPDISGGNARGNLVAGVPATQCDRTAASCAERGMFATDGSSRATGRFAGLQFTSPNTFRSRSYITGKWDEVSNATNEARYGDFVPEAYGTIWIDPKISVTTGDANLTKFEVILCKGEVETVHMVLVNGVQIPHTFDDLEMPLTSPGVPNATEARKGGWWKCVNNGDRTGKPNDDALFDSKGDPYGSICALSITVPVALAAANAAPRISVLFDAPKIRVYSTPSSFTLQKTDNYAWVLFDLLARAGVPLERFNIQSWIDEAAFCSANISFVRDDGSTGTHPRFGCSLAISQRRSAAEIIRGVRNAGRAMVFLDQDGKVSLLCKKTLASEQPAPITGSNYSTAVSSVTVGGSAGSGYFAYLFDENSITMEGGRTSLRVVKPTQAPPNLAGLTFFNRENRHSQDRLDVLDSEGQARAGRIVSGQFALEGVTTFDQARRALQTYLAEQGRGNTRNSADGRPIGSATGTIWIEFETSAKGLHLRNGHIIGVSFQRLGWVRQAFRVMQISPRDGMARIGIRAMLHRDVHYTDAFGQGRDPRNPQNFRNRLPRPSYAWSPGVAQPPSGDGLYGPTEYSFDLQAVYQTQASGEAAAKLNVAGILPANFTAPGVDSPKVPLQATTASTGGTVPCTGATKYLHVVAVTADGLSSPSEVVLAAMPSGGATGSITISGIIWPAGTTGWFVQGGDHPMQMARVASGSGTPANITVTSWSAAAAGVLDIEFNQVILRAAEVVHSGTWAQAVTAVTATTITVSVLAGYGFTTNQFAGGTLVLIGKASSASLPYCSWTVASNTSDTFTLAAGSSSPVALGVEPGDIVTMLAKPTIGSDATGNYVEDAAWSNALNPTGPELEIEYIEPTTPIRVTTREMHGAITGDIVRVWGATGSEEANGPWTATRIDDYTLDLQSSAGVAGWTGGGTLQLAERGLAVNAETGLDLLFIAGAGRGQRVKVASNTATRHYISGEWPVTPNVNSRYIVVRADWEAELSTDASNTATADKQATFSLPIDNRAGKVYLVQAFTADGGGEESPSAVSPFRMIYSFGQAARPVTSAPPGDFEASIAAGVIAPELANGLSQFVVITGAATLSAPVYAGGDPLPGTLFTLRFVMPSGGGAAITWDAIYKGVSSDADPVIDGSTYSSYTFRYSDGVWTLASSAKGLPV